MPKTKKATLLVLSSLFLIACGENSSTINPDFSSSQEETSSSSESSSSSDVVDSISFSSALNLALGDLRSNEGNFSSSVHAEKISNRDDQTITKEKLVMVTYNDSSSYGKTSIYKTDLVNSKEEYLYDSIQHRVSYQKDKIKEDDGNIGEYDMQYSVSLSSNFPSKDSSTSKKFVVASQEIADQNNLKEGTYVLEKDKGISASYDSSYKLALYISNNLLSNYASQTGVTSFSGVNTKDGTSYSTSLSYSVTEDGIETTTKESCTFVVSSSRLVSYEYSTVVTDFVSETDKTVKTDSLSVRLYYSERQEVSSRALDPNSYFLNDVTSAKIVDTFGNELDATKINKDTNRYLRALPVTYTPTTAVDFNAQTLVPTSVLDTSIASIDSVNGILEPLKTGTTTVTFAYFGKDSDGVWDNKTITLDITIVGGEPTSLFIPSSAVENNIVPLGDTVTFEASLLPSGVNQDIEVTSSNPDIISASYDASSSKVSLTGLKIGQSNITIKSISHPELSKTLSLECQTKIDLDWFNENVVGHSFKYTYSSIYGSYTRTLTFNENGKGTCVEESDKTYTDTFDCAYVEDGKLSLTNWSSNACGYSTDPDDYESDTPEKATMFIEDEVVTISVYRPTHLDYHKFKRID